MFHSDSLSDLQVERWRRFLRGLPCHHYTQDPAWVLAAMAGYSRRRRRPWYTWAEQDGELLLVGASVRQDSLLPGLSYYDFGRGPSFADRAVLQDWLPWIARQLRTRAVYVHPAPYWRLDQGGDAVETCLAEMGCHRDSSVGAWATIIVDLTPPLEDIRAGLRRQTRQHIRQSQEAGLTVSSENEGTGRAAFCDLHAELAAMTGIATLHVEELQALDRHWFVDGPGGTLLLARLEGRAVAGGVVLLDGDTAYYTTAASTRTVGKTSAGHAVLWEALRWAKDHGCSKLDLCGYNLQARQGDKLNGVNKFKIGFAPKAKPIEFCAAHELHMRPLTRRLLMHARRVKSLLSDRQVASVERKGTPEVQACSDSPAPSH